MTRARALRSASPSVTATRSQGVAIGVRSATSKLPAPSANTPVRVLGLR